MNYKKMISNDLSPRDCLILLKLNRRKNGVGTPTELADDLISPQSITQIGDKLIARGLIERDHSRDDRRKVILAITDAGREAIA